MLDMRTRLVMAIGGMVLLVVLIAVVASLIGRKTPAPAPEQPGDTVVAPPTTEQYTPTSNGTTPPLSAVPTTMAPTPSTPEEQEALYVRQLARDIVERYLSDSSLTADKNITDISAYITPQVLQWMQAEYEKPRAYDGQTAKVISSTINTKEVDAASVHVGVQLSTRAKGEENTTYKKGRVELIRDAGAWKINGIYWE